MGLVRKTIRTLAEDALDSAKGIARIGLCCGQIEKDDSFDPGIIQKHEEKSMVFYTVLGGLAGGYVSKKLNLDVDRTLGLATAGVFFGMFYAKLISPGIQLYVRNYIDEIKSKVV